VKNETIVQKEKEKRNERRLLQKNIIERISPDSSHHFARTKPSNARPQRKKKTKRKTGCARRDFARHAIS